ncbi:MAG: hypothetical protein VKK59_02670 [Vampirovibrionales bacterium]|nr:hypothetical protein [Vampirovibrionales bacterium]
MVTSVCMTPGLSAAVLFSGVVKPAGTLRDNPAPNTAAQQNESSGMRPETLKASAADGPVNQLAIKFINGYRFLKHEWMGGVIRDLGVTGRCDHAKHGCNNCSSLGLDAFKQLPAPQAALVTLYYMTTCGQDLPDDKLSWRFKAIRPFYKLSVKVIQFLHQAIYQKPIDAIVDQLNDLWRASGKPALEATA